MHRHWLYRLAWIVVRIVLSPLLTAIWLARRLTGGLRSTFFDALVDCLKVAGGHLRKWSRRFRTRDFLVGLPSLAMLCGVGTLSFLALRPSRSLEENYRYAAEVAFTEHDYAAAELCLRRLADLEGGSRDSAFALGRTAEALGQIDRCEAIMSAMAPPDRDGFGLAHIWLADHLLKTRRHSPAMLATAEQHLLCALGQFPHSVPLHDRLGQVYLELGKTHEAADQLAHAVATDRSRALLVAQLYASCGEPKLASWLATQSAEYWESQLADDPNDRRARLHRAGALCFSHRFAEAIECLNAAPKLDAECSHMLAEVYVGWADVTCSTQGVSPRVAELLASALEADRFNLTAIDRLARWRCAAGKGSRQLQLAFGQLDLADAPTDVFVLLAGVSTAQGHPLAARSYLERALALDPKSIPTVNNLAWLLSQQAPDELPRALELIDAAIRSSDAPRAELYDTRAEILMRLSHPAEAVNDLAAAMRAAPADAKRRMRFLLGWSRYLAMGCPSRMGLVQVAPAAQGRRNEL